MVNRDLLRIKLVQVLYAYYAGGINDSFAARQELNLSIRKSYDLYFYLLQLVLDITHQAQLKIDAGLNKLMPTAQEANPNFRFVNNRFAKQLEQNEMLIKHVQDNAISWSDNLDIVKKIFNEIESSDFYVSYMNADENDYSNDRNLWRSIFRRIILRDDIYEELSGVLEDECIYWVQSLDIVASFVIKTIRQFTETTGPLFKLMPMYQSDGDREFIFDLLDAVISNDKEYTEYLNTILQGFDCDTMYSMEVVVLKAALAELLNFPTIPVSATIDMYIELIKSYNGQDTARFINGILEKVVVDLKNKNKLQKVDYFAHKSK